MKKGKLYISILLGLCLCLFTAFFTACGKEETPPTPTLESISVSGETEIFIDEFDYADYTITATYSDDSTKTATLTAENLSAEDNAKLSTVGTHALTVSYESVTCSWTITLKNHNFAGLTFDDVTTTYDGTAKTLAVAGLPTGAQVSYDKATSYTNAGEYTVKATITLANYNPVELSATLTINKATYDMSAVVFADTAVTYDGQAHSIEATNLPNGVTAEYTGNSQINAGEYEIKATFTGDSANYEPIANQTATLTINKATYDMSGVRFEKTEATYDGQTHFVTATGLPSGVSVDWENNGKVNADTYTVTAKFTGDSTNYNAISNQTTTLTIHKATITGITFTGAEYTYDGEEKSLAIVGTLPNGVTVSYDKETSYTNAGEYTVTATFSKNANYNDLSDMQATLKINKATYDMSGVVFKDKSVNYTGEAYSIEATNLPEGVSAIYDGNNQTQAGEYTITAHFTGDRANYNAIPDMTAKLIISASDLTGISFHDGEFTYDGTKKSIFITGTLPEGVEVDYTNNEQINANSYTVTATFTCTNGNYTNLPELTATLTIKQRELTLAFDGENTLKYNGKAQKTITVQATNLVNGDSVELTVSYNGAMIEAGEYIATATLTAHQNYKLTANNTVKVTITRATHTVTFKQDGFAEVTREVLDLADLTDIPTPQHVDGYKFTWNRTDFTSITEDITVTANKTVITYTIEYVVYDGVNSESNPTAYTVESATFTLKNPTPSETFGKSFGGWFTSPDFTLDSKITKIEKGSFGDLKLYAYWLEYRVTGVVGGTVDYSQATPEITIKVDYGTANLAVKDLIAVSDDCTWKLYNGFECLPTQELTAKRLSVSNIGDNIFYILVYHPDSDEYYTDYVLNVYQLDMKAYTFLKDGETWASGEIQEESAVNAPENPEKDGYTFNGWKVNGEFVSFPYTVLTDTEFVAVYTPIEYTITFKTNGGTVNQLTRTYTIETGMTFEIPTREHYVFTGWYESETHEGAVTGIEIGVWGNFEFYATWTPFVYDIEYELNGGSWTSGNANPTTYTIETETITLANPTKTGYGFKGWYLEETIETRVYTVEKGSYGDKKFYAKWGENTNTLKFDGNGATGGATSDIEMKTAETVALPKCGFVKAGYTFIGWATNADGEVVYIDGANYTMGTNAEYTLYAIWQANLNTLKFDGNGTTGGSTAEMSIYTDETKTLTANGFEKAGYTFIGWALTADGEVAFADKANYTMGVNAEYTLHAVWQAKNNTLKFNGNGYTSGSMSSMTIATDSTAMLTANNFVRTGYTFIGWATSADGEVVYTDCADYIMGMDSSYTLYAVWLGNLNTIYFDGNGATSGEMSSVQARTGEKITLPLNEYVKTTDYTCTGWATTASGYMYYADGASYTVGTASEQTLYAYWKQQTASGLVWLIRNNEVSIATYVGTNVGLAIPETIAGYPVTGIDSSAFKDCSSLTSVEIPDSVTSIGSGAFEGCSSLTEITLPFVGASSSVTSASSSTLFGYIFGTSVYTGGRATIQYYTGWSYETYYIPTSLKSVTITGGNILYGAFRNCSSLTSVVIGDGVTSIGEYAFYNCSSLTSVVIGNSVTSIGECAFYNCSSLTSVVIPDSVTSIVGWAFESCGSLTGVYITDVAAWCNISFGNSVANPLYYAKNLYLNNELITELTIPNTVTEIKAYAFFNCSSLSSVAIGNSVTSIGSSAFSGCSGLTVYCEVTNKPSGWNSSWNNSHRPVVWNYAGKKGVTDDGIVWGQTKDNTICLISYTGISMEVVIPNTINTYPVLIIAERAFYNCSSLTSVVIPDSVTSIGSFAFSGCSGLTSVVIPDSVTSIGSSAFSGCSGLTSVVIPDSVTSIGSSAFERCSSLTGIYITDIEAWLNISFGSASANPLYYAKNLYLDNELVTELEIPNTITEIKAYAFSNCSSLTSVAIGNSVTSIGSSAFSGCSGLTSVAIGNSVTSIGSSAFRSCTGLTSIEIPDGVESIDSSAFNGCSSLMSVAIGNSVTSIGSYTFENCSSLTSIMIPDSVTSIGSYVFNGCSSLTRVAIGNSVTSIGSYAFNGCSSLTNVVIGESVTSIDSNAFRSCTGLTSVIIPKNVVYIGADAFYECSNLEGITFADTTTWYTTNSSYNAKNKCNGREARVVNPKMNVSPFIGLGHVDYWYKL